MKEEFINRLRDTLIEKNITAADLARKSGIRASSISDYLTGKYEPKQDKIDAIATALNVSPAWLMGYANDETKVQATRIPVLGTVIAGAPAYAEENIIGWEEVTQKMASRGKLFALKVKGDSMLPKFEEGDIVIVKEQEDVESGDIAIVLVNGDEATMKQVQKKENGIWLYAFNPAVYEPHFYSNKDIEILPVRIVGKVIESRRSW